MSKRYYVVDIQVTETADTLARALEIAQCWMDDQESTCNDADDETLRRWYRSGSRGLDAGDVEIWESEGDRIDGERIRIFSGREIIERVAEARGIR